MHVAIVLLGLLTYVVVTDVRWGRIPNHATGPAIVGGMALNGLTLGSGGLSQAVAGTVLGLGLLLIPFALGKMGAGDVKLLAAIGALAGPAFLLPSFFYGAIVGGAISLGLLAYQHRMLSTLRWLPVCLTPQPSVELRGQPTSFPYSPAIAAGVLLQLAVIGVKL